MEKSCDYFKFIRTGDGPFDIRILPVSRSEWSHFVKVTDCAVNQTWIGNYFISTVFMGSDCTMFLTEIFNQDDAEISAFSQRSRTIYIAHQQHKDAVRMVQDRIAAIEQEKQIDMLIARALAS